jgi:tetratricopeptide (TPR) repeat protein
MTEKEEQPPQTDGSFTGSDEFRKEDDSVGPVMEEGSFTPAPTSSAPPPPTARADKALLISVGLASVVLLGGMIAMYALMGGFSPPGEGPEPSPPRPEPIVALPPPPPQGPLADLSHAQIRRLAEELEEKNKTLKSKNLTLDLEVKRWKYRVEKIDERYLADLLKRYIEGLEEEQAGARAVLAQRGGSIASALLAELDERIDLLAKIRQELREARQEAQVSIKSLLRLQVRVSELENTKRLEDAGTYYRHGVRQSDAGDYAKAVASLGMAISFDPSLDPAYNARGLARLALGRTQEALADFEKATELNPSSPIFHLNRGKALLKLKRPEEARGALQTSLRLRPGSAEALKLLGEIDSKD